MALSKKYYEEIARILGETKVSSRTIDKMVIYFKSDNPRFSATRFVAAIKKAKLSKLD